MQMVNCKECGKQYNYDIDAFCPKCGCFNPPPGSASAQRERERAAQARQGRANSALPRRGTPDVRPAWDGAPSRKRSPVVSLAVIGIIAAVTAGIVLCVNYAGQTLMDGGLLLSSPASEAPAPEGGYHMPYEEFTVNGWRVSVEDVWEAELTPSAYVPEDCRCVAVDLWIEDGTRRSDLAFFTPYLELEDGTQIEAVDGDALLSRQLKQAGLYDVVPADAQWEDPLYGQLVFFVPKELEGTVTLVLPEGMPGEPDSAWPAACHSIELELPVS